MTHEHITEILTKHSITVPQEKMLHASYTLATNDWFVQTESGWFWWDDRKRIWVLSPNHRLQSV